MLYSLILRWRWPLFWFFVGLLLRLLNLAGKPVWADEWTTFVFSLGHSFRDLPLNQLLSLEQFLQPVRLDGATAWQGVQHLMRESTHPPLYFWLSHAWIQLWQQPGEMVSPWVGRSLSVLFGSLAIPLTYGLGRTWGLSQRTAHLAMALMAVSPYGIYLAQDARHYTLAMLWGMLSLGYFVQAWRSLHRPLSSRDFAIRPAPGTATPPHRRLSKRRVWCWISINALGFATHYMFAIFLAAQGLALGVRWLMALSQRLRQGLSWQRAIALGWTRPWRRILWAAAGSFLAMLPWAVFLGRASDNELTAWIAQDLSGLRLVEPLGRLLTWLLSMVMLLPVEQVPMGVAIASGVLMLVALVWLLPLLWRGGRKLWQRGQGSSRGAVLRALLAVFGAQVAVLLLLAYGFQRDLTLSPRYVFALLPEWVLGLALVLGALGVAGRRGMVLLLLLGVLGSGSVALGYGYQKADRPDLLVQQISAYYRDWRETTGEAWPRDPLAVGQSRPLVIGIIQKTHSETGKLLGVAQEWYEQAPAGLQLPSFVLLRRNPYTYAATRGIRDATATVERPFDLWILNFSASANFRDLGCSLDYTDKLRSPGYSARRFVCN